jgi:hypothetical protein
MPFVERQNAPGIVTGPYGRSPEDGFSEAYSETHLHLIEAYKPSGGKIFHPILNLLVAGSSVR